LEHKQSSIEHSQTLNKNSSREVAIQPNTPLLAMRKVEKWSEMIDQVERTFDNMLNWKTEEFWHLQRLKQLALRIEYYQEEIERFRKKGLSKAGRLEAIAIRNNPRETPARRRAAADKINRSKWIEECFFRADVNLRKYFLFMIYTQRKLELRRSLENY
jgi:hypothetical protein